jgi:hypothetical protein
MWIGITLPNERIVIAAPSVAGRCSSPVAAAGETWIFVSGDGAEIRCNFWFAGARFSRIVHHSGTFARPLARLALIAAVEP